MSTCVRVRITHHHNHNHHHEHLVCHKAGKQPLPKRVFRQCDLVRAMSMFSTFMFSQGHPVAADTFFLFFPSFKSLTSALQLCDLEGSSYAIYNQSIYPSSSLLYVGYSSPPWLHAILVELCSITDHTVLKWFGLVSINVCRMHALK